VTKERLPYQAPTLESLGSLVELTKTGAGGPPNFDGAGYVPNTPPPGS
jgi:hypothetical protein